MKIVLDYKYIHNIHKTLTDNWSPSNPIMLPSVKEQENIEKFAPSHSSTSLFVSLDYPVAQQHTHH